MPILASPSRIISSGPVLRPQSGVLTKFGQLGTWKSIAIACSLSALKGRVSFSVSGVMPTRSRLYRYPHHNCAAAFNTGQAVVDPQTVFPTYLNHQSVVDFVAQYTSSANRAVGHNKPFMMFETNTASCGGFPGISRSFGSAMWATDYGLQMAFNNFSNALLHVGGQSVYYNVCLFII